MRQLNLHNARSQQQGFVLLFVLLLLIGLMITSAGFFYRANNDTKLSGTERDYDQALLLAESGGNLVAGLFFNIGDANTGTNPFTGCGSSTMVGDLNCNGFHDNPEGRPISAASGLPKSADGFGLGYQFYLTTSASAGITQTTPGILQRVADGEARNSGSAITTREVLTSRQYLRVRDLFSSVLAPSSTTHYIRPFLFTQTSTGLARSTQKWQDEPSTQKVAVWLEVTKNPTDSTTFDNYLCAVAQVGNAKAYLLRFLGTYPVNLIQMPSPLSESANHG